MARELPIRNGRLTTDLDAAGHKIKNLPPGEGFTQAQADWNQTDATAPDFIKNKPTIPAPVTVDSVLSTTSENPVQNRVVAAAMDARPTKAEIDAGWWSEWVVRNHGSIITNADITYFPTTGYWSASVDGDFVSDINGSADATYIEFPESGRYLLTATRHRVAAPVPTKTSDLTNDGSDGEHPFLTSHQDISGKADKSEMSVTAGIGADADKTTIKLKGDGTQVNPNVQATVLTAHQSLSGLMPKYTFVTATVASGTLTVAPYTLATYTADSTAAAFSVAVGALPTGVTGKVRDCILVIDCTATGAVAPTVTWDAHFHPRTDTATDLAIVEAGKRAVFYISEYAAGEFAVGGWVETEGGSGT